MRGLTPAGGPPLARGFWSLFGFRFLLGAGEAPAYPSATKAASRWFPRHERAFATAVIDSGSRVGTVLSLPIVTALIALVSWHFSFVVLGVVGIIWAAVWYWYCRDPLGTSTRTRPSVTTSSTTAPGSTSTTTRTLWRSAGATCSATGPCAA